MIKSNNNHYKFGGAIIVPIQMIEFVYIEKKSKEFRLYLQLKISCDGKINLTSKDLNKLAQELNYCRKTLIRQLNYLVSINWIGYDPITYDYFIRGFDSIRKCHKFHKLQRRTAAVLELEYINHLNIFCFSALVADILNHKRAKLFELKTERKRRRSQQVFTHPISNNYLSTIFKKSKSTIFEHKKEAVLAGFLNIKKSNEFIGIEPSEVNFLRRGFPQESKVIKIIYQDKKPIVVKQNSDLISHNLKFKNRKKIEPLIKEISN